MRTLHFMIFKMFIRVFLVTIIFFVFVFQLMDIFSNIWRYTANEISILDIGKIALYYIPKCIYYTLPLSLLFSITFTLGNYYMNNELVAIFSSGISIYRLTFPFILFSILLSLFFFLFDEMVVIDTFKIKNQLSNIALKQQDPYTNTNFGLKTADNKIIYQPRFFNGKQNTFNELTIIQRDDSGNLVKRIDSNFARWNGTNWVLEECRIFTWNRDKTFFEETYSAIYDDKLLSMQPEIFQKQTRKIEEMQQKDAYAWVNDLKAAGKSFQKELSEYYKKFAFSLTPLIIALISCSVGGLLRKNILLMSLLFSVSIAVVYFVIQMVTMSLASNGYISPFAGAWSSFILFTIIGIAMFKMART